jgi:hypothetical protein
MNCALSTERERERERERSERERKKKQRKKKLRFSGAPPRQDETRLRERKTAIMMRKL